MSHAQPDTPSARATLYEFAGGREALRRLAGIQYARCLTDPVLSEIFGTDGRPEHVDHLADWLTEVLGGPKLYTERHGGHEALLGHHADLRIDDVHRSRFVEVFVEALDAAGLPDDELFRRRLREYLDWGSRIAQEISQPGGGHVERPAGAGLGLGRAGRRARLSAPGRCPARVA
ncbi:MAG TPA: group II truncated hemoglobin [Solirubrobacteraceae bacterium]|jgi:hemoglobin|nr:group II truncated hemoglobin [Solirubrobacteraceae bacterium]